MTRLNDATPADWDRLRTKYPAIEPSTTVPLEKGETHEDALTRANSEAEDALAKLLATNSAVVENHFEPWRTGAEEESLRDINEPHTKAKLLKKIDTLLDRASLLLDQAYEGHLENRQKRKVEEEITRIPWRQDHDDKQDAAAHLDWSDPLFRLGPGASDMEWKHFTLPLNPDHKTDAYHRHILDSAVYQLETTMNPILPTDAAERKAIPIYTGFIKYFPRAIAEVAKLSLVGGIQHGQTAETLHWDRSKSGDELDAMMRHILDGDWAQVAWRAMANLEKKEEAKEKG